MTKYSIERELKQMLHNSLLPRLIFVFSCVVMILMPWAINSEIKNINLNIVDSDHSIVSRRLVDKIKASTYFRLTALPAIYDKTLLGIEASTAGVILEIFYDFEKDWVSGKAPRLLVAANVVDETKGSLGGSYLSSIISDYSRKLTSEVPVKASTGKPLPRVSVSTLNLYNSALNYKLFMIPALTVTLLTLICTLLPAFSVMGERGAGTIEQINVTPINKFTSIAAKLILYWLIGFAALTICFILAQLLYGTLPAGHFPTIYVFALVFPPVVLGFRLAISNHSVTLQQAMLVMRFSMPVLILINGLLTPIHGMSGWAQWTTRINPLRYLVEMTRIIHLRNGGLAELFSQLGALLIFATVANT